MASSTQATTMGQQQHQQHYQPERDTVIWTHFGHVEFHHDDCGGHPIHVQKKLYLILAYSNGFQVFDVNEPKRILEIASVRGAPVRFATILSPPSISCNHHSNHTTTNNNTTNTNNNNNNNKNTNNNNNEIQNNINNNETQKQESCIIDPNSTNNNVQYHQSDNNNETSEDNSSFVHLMENPLLAVVHANDPSTLKFFSLKTHS